MTEHQSVDEAALECYHRVVAHVGIEPNRLLDKSALYGRLCEGRAPLVVPPPLSHSYPWYEAVESGEPLAIMEPFVVAADEDFAGRQGLVINQCFWTLLDGAVAGAGGNEKRVTYPGWEELGFTWRVWLERVPAERSESCLCCHHDPAAKRITTPEQVDAEARYLVQRDYDRLKLVAALPLDEATKAILAEYESKSQSPSEGTKIRRNYNQTVSRYEAERYARRLALRREEGMPDLPSDEELAAGVARERKSILSHGWEIADGKLWHWRWLLQREAPAQIGPEHYLTI